MPFAISGAAACHVCSARPAEHIYRDENGFALRTCDESCCKDGYRYERPYKPSKQAEEAA